MHKKKDIKNIKIYLSPMLPTKYSREERQKIRQKEKEIFESTSKKV